LSKEHNGTGGGRAISDIPDSTVVYVPGIGETTAGDIRGQADTLESTVAMWGYIATHPDAKPWLGRRPPTV
jgi:hypothetical protein